VKTAVNRKFAENVVDMFSDGAGRMASAANCRPAIQPSVRASSAAMSPVDYDKPMTSVEKVAASGCGMIIASAHAIAHPQ
jgi:hypothetical protein